MPNRYLYSQFTAEVFPVAKIQEASECPSAGGCIKKLCVARKRGGDKEGELTGRISMLLKIECVCTLACVVCVCVSLLTSFK